MYLSRMNSISVLSTILLSVTALQAEVSQTEVEITLSRSGKNLTITNELARLDHNLSRGTYDAIDRRDKVILEADKMDKNLTKVDDQLVKLTITRDTNAAVHWSLRCR